ncbi:MAG: Si-specific NAD(P)(+) transhydrogenase [Planctomycetota bacterium]|nr:Si-specific NAD(P)(+) transhydrogenase [Planctomycetota bacterium]MDA1139357.1 Si-specific NAD(P)(+) transhydrogenase [Planctomycetota bacterium]
MDPKDYDLVVIGSGPAGEKGAAQVAYFGKKVAIIEKEPHFGGAAANTGTLPSKTLRETSMMLSGFRARGLYGVDLSLRREATVRDFLYREEQVVAAERERANSNVARHGIDVYRGLGSFVDPHTVRVQLDDGGEEFIRGEVILVSTGSYPHRPDIYEFDHPLVYDSDEILQIHIMPKILAVVGAGVIGSEYACLFKALDVDVHLIDGREELMGFLDREISTSLKTRMQKIGIEMVMPDSVESCVATDTDVTLTLASGRKLVVDAVLVASGRTGNTAKLNVDAAGLEMGRRGQMSVNENYQTNVPHIYAAGDVIGFPALASTSMEQARLAMVHAFNLQYKKEVAPILPYGIYTIPEVSMAGESEESAKEKGIDYVVGRASYANNARGMIIGDFDGFLKLLYRSEDMKLIGAHVIGEIASEILHIGLIAMMTDSSNELFMRTCFNYPTLGELYKYATYDAMGNLAKRKTAEKD